MNAHDRVVQDLTIVSMLGEQDKLVTNPCFGLRPATTFRAMLRRLWGENRATDLLNLRNLFSTAICLARLNESEAAGYMHHDKPLERFTNFSTDRLLETVCAAVGGLRILKRTYHDDLEMCGRLELLIQEVTDHVQAIRPHILLLPAAPDARANHAAAAAPDTGDDDSLAAY